MNDEMKAALSYTVNGHGYPDAPCTCATCVYLDGEPARLAAAREEQREACARRVKDAIDRYAYSDDASEEAVHDACVDACGDTPLDATPLADELRTLRALVADMESIDEALRQESAALREENRRLTEDLADCGVRLGTAERTVIELRARVAELEAMRAEHRKIAIDNVNAAYAEAARMQQIARTAEAQVAARGLEVRELVEAARASVNACRFDCGAGSFCGQCEPLVAILAKYPEAR